MVLLSIFFTRIRSTEIISRLFFIHLSLHALALHLAVKISASSLSVWRFEHVMPYICRLYFPPECQQDRTFVHQPILLSENIPNIWHKSSTKHKKSNSWNDKNDNANYAPSCHMEGFTNGSGCHFKEIFDQVRKDLDCELFYSELKRLTSHIIFTI